MNRLILSVQRIPKLPVWLIALSFALAAFPASRPVVAQTIELGRGINLGNAFDGPFEGAWGLSIEERFFDLIVEGGFDHVRLPVSWTWHTDHLAPFEIDEEFFLRIDEVVAFATSRGLKIIINNHHHDEFMAAPLAQWDRTLAMWEQIAERYQDLPNDLVAFEILNEPHGVFNEQPALWNQFMAEALTLIRESNPTRTVLLGPVLYNSVRALSSFEPPIDPNIIVSVHYYEPFKFTHQGAPWITPTPPTGVFWSANRRLLTNDWQDWSWGTTTTSTTAGIRVKWNEGYGAFRVHHNTGIADAKEVVFTCNRAETIRVKAQRADGTGEEVIVETDDTFGYYRVPISGTPTSPVTDIYFANSTPDPQPEFTIRHIGMPVNGSFNRIVSSSASAIYSDLSKAAKWGEDKGIPIHLGEFGAYRLGNITTRTNWTRSVRSQAERLGMGWAYWEFGAEFGIYDPARNRWQPLLTKALRPDFNPE